MGPRKTKVKSREAGKPGFDETALAQLTSKIDKSLGDSDQQHHTKRKRPRDNDDGHASKRHQARPSERGSRREPIRGPNNRQLPNLLDEILALGGNEDDLELVADIDSGDEGGGAPRQKVSSEIGIDKSLKDELALFASSLGLNKFRTHEDPETDEESVDVDEDAGQGTEQETGQETGQDSEQDSEHDSRAGDQPNDVVAPPQEPRQGKKSGKLIFDPRPDWYALSSEGLPLSVPNDSKQYADSISNLKAYAEKLLEHDSSQYLAAQASSSSQKFMSTIMSSGTLSDKVSALTLSVQESPLHTRKAFESLVTLAGKRSRGQAIAALGALVDLMSNGTVLPDDRRLRPFNAQPVLLGALGKPGGRAWAEGQKLPGKLTEPHLMMWAYEDWLKGAYFRIIQLLEIWCSDEIEYSRSRALDFVFGLLKNKPEQEANLLRLLVNKLGDRERKIASRASHLVLQLLTIHPGMKAIIVGTVEREVLLKPGQNMRTTYTAVNTLNQTILSTKEPGVADTLLRIYFEMFLALLKAGSLGDFEAHDGDKKPSPSQGKRKKRSGSAATAPAHEQETGQKLVSALLTGVNRAIPFATAEDSTLEKHLDTLFRITHSSNFNTSVQALMLMQQLAASRHLAVDRFYRTLYESLLDPRLITSSKHALYLNLLFRAMKNDVDVRRVKAFVKRLIQVLSLHQPSFTNGTLFLIAELQATFPDLHTLLDEPEGNGDDGEEVFKDVREDDSGVEQASIQQHAVTYDGRKRDPEHSNAHKSCLWELVPLFAHYHPSVCVFAGNLLARQKALPKPDLANHTLMHFLDKFVYRNPKAEESKRGGSIMQPILAAGSSSHVLASSKAASRQQPIVNSSSFWNLKPEQVSAEDVFFHEYFARVGKHGEPSRAKETADNDHAASDDEADGEGEIWDALVNSRPEIEGPDAEEGSDIDMEEYDYSDNDMELDEKDNGATVSALESESEDGFEGIFDDSEESDEVGSGAEEDGTEDEEGARDISEHGRRRRLNRKEMRSLPTFASVDDYAEMLAAEDD
ncbi:ribosome biogenesis protein MAK21 [Staphylotrichum tortipilum]|uniref:Ribosome biogenesis protein MAK21 n=1 Tax=Staphylotrichum tortipilum TaxID=2831512 RepID=A0AAN6MTR8_9PEZI|nr:ribosome biogenesis protein MAK21 [Staphylotrichum longicolle]